MQVAITPSSTGQIEAVNACLVRLLGYAHGEMPGKKLWEVGAFANVERCNAALAAFHAEGYVRWHGLPLKNRGGTFVSNSYICDGVRRMQCSFRDSSASSRLTKSDDQVGHSSAYSNEGIMMLHSTSLASVVTLLDLTGAAREVNSRYFVPFEAFITAAVCYLLLTFALLAMFRRAERHWMRHLAPRGA